MDFGLGVHADWMRCAAWKFEAQVLRHAGTRPTESISGRPCVGEEANLPRGGSR
jgi:hypothetical protein